MNITLKELKKKIADTKSVILIEFWGSWCPPCQMMKPIFEEIKKEYQDKIKIIEINTDLNPILADYFEIQRIPTIILLKNRKEKQRLVAAKPKSAICKLIEKNI